MRAFGRKRFGSSRGFSSGFGGRGGFGGRPAFGSRDVPVKVGEEHDVEITEVGSRGDGIARIQNFVVFVAGTKKGDNVKIKITQIRGRSAIGEVVEGAATGEISEEPSEPENEPVEIGTMIDEGGEE
ncbi:MAG: TRAM domain-containing protein [Candidatus Aenigmatarchaeota archaeon]|nr:TRAM domain-containing protein [Candidatus Aenigmarchaeota archaeon]